MYEERTESRETGPGTGPRGFTVAAWIVITLLVAVQIGLAALEPVAEAGDAAAEPVVDVLSRIQGGYVVGAYQMMPNELLYAEAKTQFNHGSVGQRLRFVVLAAELAGIEEARLQLEALVDLIASEQIRAETEGTEPPVVSAEDEAALGILARLYAAEDGGDDRPAAAARAAALPEADRTLLRERLGWYGDLALAPPGTEDVDARTLAIAPAKRTFLTIIGAAIGGGTLAVAGFIGLVVLLIFALIGRLRALAPSPVHHGIYAETFAVWMAVFLGGQLLAGAIAAMLDPSLHLVLVLVAFFASLIALAWPVIRGVSWRQVREDVGLTGGRNPFLEILIGPASYAMTLPILGGGVILTFCFMMIDGMLRGAPDPLDPETGPAHPVVAELGGGNWLIIIQVLLLGAVAAPIVEETMFRGVLYRHLRGASANLGIALSIFASAMLNTFVFAIIHPQGWVAVPVLMALALGFTLAREWRGSLIPCMIAHGLSNALVLGTITFVLSG